MTDTTTPSAVGRLQELVTTLHTLVRAIGPEGDPTGNELEQCATAYLAASQDSGLFHPERMCDVLRAVVYIVFGHGDIHAPITSAMAHALDRLVRTEVALTPEPLNLHAGEAAHEALLDAVGIMHFLGQPDAAQKLVVAADA